MKMNFEQLSEKYKRIAFPENTQLKGTPNGEVSDFLDYLKHESQESKQKFYRFYVIYGIAAVLYIFTFIINPDPELTLADRIMGTSFILAFSILLVVFKTRYTQIKNSSFLETPRIFLKNARDRHLFRKKGQLLWETLVVILIDVGLSISVPRRFENLEPIIVIICVQIVLFVLIYLGYKRNKKEWRKNKKPILLKIEEMLAGFEDQ